MKRQSIIGAAVLSGLVLVAYGLCRLPLGAQVELSGVPWIKKAESDFVPRHSLEKLLGNQPVHIGDRTIYVSRKAWETIWEADSPRFVSVSVYPVAVGGFSPAGIISIQKGEIE